MTHKNVLPSGETFKSPLCLAESRLFPTQPEDLKTELDENEPIMTEFIGTSLQDCQSWIRDHCDQNTGLEYNQLFVADAHSARDNTILASVYPTSISFGDVEDTKVLPPQADTWYDFRIDYKDIMYFYIHIAKGEPDLVYYLYFAHPERCTDEHDVFSVTKAKRLATSGSINVLDP